MKSQFISFCTFSVISKKLLPNTRSQGFTIVFFFQQFYSFSFYTSVYDSYWVIFLRMMWNRAPTAFFCMLLHLAPLWKDYSFLIELPWSLCQKAIDDKYMDLFLNSQFNHWYVRPYHNFYLYLISVNIFQVKQSQFEIVDIFKIKRRSFKNN